MTTEHPASERAVLGAAMSIENGHAFDDASAHITAGDFAQVQHREIWTAIAGMRADGIPADPVLVAERLGADLARLGGAVYLATLYQAACSPQAVAYHAQLIADAATIRRLLTAGQRIVQRAESSDVDPAELVQWAATEVAAARDERQGVDVLTKSYAKFFAATPDDRTMVIPGLLGEGDRLVLTGAGGLGKSTILAQIAVAAASGLQPFDWHCEDPYDPVRVTILDFENPDHRVKTRLWPMVQDCLKHNGADPRPQLSIGGHGNPLNLLNPQNALSLLRTIEHDRPQLVYIGPAYKMHNDDPDKESVVKKITDVLDAIRAMGVAIITEAHHTKEGRRGGTLEPSGSNLWTWWPEFGLGLRLAGDAKSNLTRRCDLERWRIDRESALWPDEVEASGQLGFAWARASVPLNGQRWAS